MRSTRARLPQAAFVSAFHAVLMSAVAAEAQDRTVPSGGIDEIIVTAQKREATAQNTAAALSAFTGDVLTNRSIDGLVDLQYAVPGLTFGENVGSSGAQIALRGVGAENPSIGGDGGVAVHVDGVYVQSPSFLSQEFFDIERVEVLRGPQGTLWGRNATGGAINIITKGPSEEFSAWGRASFGNFDRKMIQAAVGGPIDGEVVSGRVAFAAARRDGFVENVAPSAPEPDAQSTDYWMLRTGFTVNPSEDFSATLRGHLFRDNGRRSPLLILEDYPSTPLFLGIGPGPTFVFGNYYNSFGAAPNPTVANRRTYRSNTPINSEEDAHALSLDLSWDLGPAILTAITGYNDNRFRYQYDIDASDVVSIEQSRFQTGIETVSQEIRLASDHDGALEWLIGAYYYSESSDLSFLLSDLSFNDLTGFGVSTFSIDPVDAKAKSYAVFGNATYMLGDRFGLTAGVRYSSDEKELTETVAAPLLGLPTVTSEQEDSWDQVTWTAGLRYDVTDEILAYASASTGYKAGGIQVGGFGTFYDPETIMAYEAGVKSSFANNRAQLNLSGFYYDYEDYQVFQIIGLLGTFVNSDAIVKGFEAELTASPIKNLLLNATASWLDATYDDPGFVSDDPATGALAVSLDGNRLNRAPEWKYSVGAQYTHDVGNLGFLTGRVDFAYVGKQFYRVFNLDQDAQNGYHQTNLRLTWTDHNENWRIEGWVKNLEDEDVVNTIRTSSTSLGATANGILSPPRTFGVTLGFDY